MKNIDYTLGEEIPKEIRLEVYKETLLFLKGKESKYGLDPEHDGLCLIIPCILWDLDHYLDDSPNERFWDYNETTKSFPEFGKLIDLIYQSKSDNHIYENRIKVLETIIKDLE